MQLIVIDQQGRQMSLYEHDARIIISQFEEFCKKPENPEGPDQKTYLMDLITKALEKTARETKSFDILDNLLSE